MRHTFILLILVIVVVAPCSLSAQDIGQVKHGARFFTTDLPRYYEDDNDNLVFPEDRSSQPKLTNERRDTAIAHIEKVFGKVKEYNEMYSECCGRHHFSVTLESGDELDFEDGELCGYYLTSPRFPVAAEWFKGGLRVGQEPPIPVNEHIHTKARERDPSCFVFWDDRFLDDMISTFRIGPDGKIISITVYFNEC